MEQEILINALNEAINKEVEKRVAEQNAEVTVEKIIEKINLMTIQEFNNFIRKVCENDGNKKGLIDYVKYCFPRENELDNDTIMDYARENLDDADIKELVSDRSLESEIAHEFIDNADRCEKREIIDNILDEYM